MQNNLIEGFMKSRRYLTRAQAQVQISPSYEDGSQCIYIGNPIIISSFIGYLKNIRNGNQIYYRGEAEKHEHVIPSLFRKDKKPLTDNHIISQRFKAYMELKTWFRKTLGDKFSRFKNEELDNIFQHYGIASPVIDLVDNIYVAIWFAMGKNNEGFGYIRIINASGQVVSDLRKIHSSLSLRMHTQHGLIVKKDVKKWNASNICYDELEVAKIKFPISKKIESGILFSEQNIYPNQSLDHTLFVLKKSKRLQLKIESLELKYKLNNGDLGRII